MPTRLAAPLLAVALLAGLAAAGCGSSSIETDGSRTGTVTDVVPIPAPGPGGNASEAPVGASARSCDSDAADAEALRATNVSCDQARRVLYGWQREPSCATVPGASRDSCGTRSYRCQAVRTDRGVAVSCSRPGQSIAFIVRRG